MKLMIGFVLGLIVTTATSLSAEMGSWNSNGHLGTYYNGPLGTQYQDLSTGQSGLLNTQPMPSYGPRNPC